MQWSLEDIYKKQVHGKIPPRKHLRVLGEQTSWSWSHEPQQTTTTTIEDPEQLTFNFHGVEIDSEEDIDKTVDDLKVSEPVKEKLKRQLKEIARIEDPDKRQQQAEDLEATIDTHSTRFKIKEHLNNKGWNDKVTPRYADELVAKIKHFSTLGDESIEKLEEFIIGGKHPEFKPTPS